MKTSAMLDERSLGLLKQYGYIPYAKEPTNEPVAKALEYCLADDGVAKTARLLGKTDDYNYFPKRSRSYAKYFDRQTGFMRAVSSDGKFRTPFDPIEAAHRVNDYTEGNAWQYTWLVPHAVHSQVSLFGSEKNFVTKLDSLFVVEGDLGENASPDISGLVGPYAHGNEPSHHITHLYNYAGVPWRTQELVDQVLRTLYSDAPDGLSGNEDCGQMSAWYVMNAMGFYQVCPGRPVYSIGRPLFEEVTLRLEGGKTFVIRAKNNSEKNKYIRSATLNGRPLEGPFFTHEELMAGGVLEFVMSDRPEKWNGKETEGV